MILQGVELLTLWVTVITIALAVKVVAEWTGASKKYLKNIQDYGHLSVDSIGWFILGVWFGHLSMVLDNAYWQVAWSAIFIEHELGSTMSKYGIIPNLPFRACLGMMAAYCHLRALVVHKEFELSKMHQYLYYSVLGGGVFILGLLGLGYYIS